MNETNLITLSESQSRAKEVILKWYFSKRKYHFLLGEPGTGKSFLVSIIIKNLCDSENLSPSKILCLAPSHKAKNIIKNFFNDQGLNIECNTIHSALGKVLKENLETGKQELKTSEIAIDKQEKTFIHKDLVIIDEISMLTNDLVEDLAYCSRVYGFKTLLLGDIDQLPPIHKDIKDHRGKWVSFPYKSNCSNTFPILRLEGDKSKLIEIMRYDNPKLIELIKKSQGCIHDEMRFSPYPFIKKDEIKIISEKEAVDLMVSLKWKRKEFACLSFTNKKQFALVRQFRPIFYGETNPDQFFLGETFYCNKQVYDLNTVKENKDDSFQGFQNGDIVSIEHIEFSAVETNHKLYETFKLTCKDINTGKVYCVSRFVDQSDFEKVYSDLQSSLRKADYQEKKKLNGVKFYLDKMNADLRTLEFMTYHKSQGSSFDNVFCFDDFRSIPKIDFIQPRLWYVGLSRSKNNVYIIK